MKVYCNFSISWNSLKRELTDIVRSEVSGMNAHKTIVENGDNSVSEQKAEIIKLNVSLY